MVEENGIITLENTEKIYLYLDYQYFLNEEEIDPSGIQMQGNNGLSGNWGILITPLWSLHYWRKPERKGVISFNIDDIQSLNYSIEHKPSNNNPTHVLIKGFENQWQNELDKSRIQTQLERITNIEIYCKGSLCENCKNYRSVSNRKAKCSKLNKELTTFSIVISDSRKLYNLGCYYYKKNKNTNIFIVDENSIKKIKKSSGFIRNIEILKDCDFFQE